MTISTRLVITKAQIKDLEIITRWMKDDVLKAYKNNINIGTVLLVFAHIDALGYYLEGVDIELRRRNYRTKIQNDKYSRWSRGAPFHKFIRNYMPLLQKNCSGKRVTLVVDREASPPVKKRVGYLKALYTHYRHGVVHEHMMKAGTGITRDSDKYIHTKRGYFFIDIGFLAEEFMQAVENYKKDVLNHEKIARLYARRRSFILNGQK